MKENIIIGLVLSAILFFAIGGPIIETTYREDVLRHPQVYVYDSFSGVVNPAMIIEDRDDEQELIEYYQQMKTGANPIFNFPLKTLPPTESVYLMGVTSDGQLADVVSYYDRGGKFGGAYLRGYVYVETVHREKP